MGSNISSGIMCKTCGHHHHGKKGCIKYNYTNYPKCGCSTTNFMRERVMYEIAPISGFSLMYYPDVVCEKCTIPCECKKCTCSKCIKKSFRKVLVVNR